MIKSCEHVFLNLEASDILSCKKPLAPENPADLNWMWTQSFPLLDNRKPPGTFAVNLRYGTLTFLTNEHFLIWLLPLCFFISLLFLLRLNFVQLTQLPVNGVNHPFLVTQGVPKQNTPQLCLTLRTLFFGHVKAVSSLGGPGWGVHSLRLVSKPL